MYIYIYICLAPASGGWLWSVIITAFLILPPPPVSLSWLLCPPLFSVLSSLPMFTEQTETAIDCLTSSLRPRHPILYKNPLPSDLQWPLCHSPRLPTQTSLPQGATVWTRNWYSQDLVDEERSCRTFTRGIVLQGSHLCLPLSTHCWVFRGPHSHRWVGLRAEQAAAQPVIRQRRGCPFDQRMSSTLWSSHSSTQTCVSVCVFMGESVHICVLIGIK